MADDGVTYEMVMPFIVCTSRGGPYDDAAFVAGVNFHEIRTRLEIGRPDALSEYVQAALVPQLDLLAMKLGYALDHEPWDEHPDEWEMCRFTRPDEVVHEG